MTVTHINASTKTQPLSYSTTTADLAIRDLEQKHNLLQYTVEGWSVWPILRFNAVMGLLDLPLVKTDRIGIRQLLPIALNDLGKLVSVRQARHAVMVYASNRSESENGLYRDIFVDELLLNIGDYYKIEHVDNKIFIPTRQAALIKGDITSTACKISARLLGKIKYPTYLTSIAHSLSHPLQEELGLKSFTPAAILQSLSSFYWTKKLYTWLLGRIKPEYLFLVSAYGDHSVVAAAKELGITVIEFQHGFVNQYHTGYSWTPYALPYKATMPIPDRLFLYGRYWAQELEAIGFWQEELRVVGSLRMDRYRHKATKNQGDKLIIVLTTQGLDTEQLVAFIKEFLKLAHERLAFQLYIKLHPMERTKELYETAFKDNNEVQILLSHEPPSTFDLLATAHLHLSISSTCHYEALGLGASTIILPFTNHEDVLPLHEAGSAFLVQTPEAMLNIALNWQRLKVTPEIGSFYFEANAVANMKKELEL